MIATRRDVTAWAVGLVFIAMGSATAVFAKVNYQQIESGDQDDSMFVTVTHRSANARPIEATVTESPVQLREQRQASIAVAVPAAAPSVVSKAPIAAVATADGRSLQQPKFLAPRRVASAGMQRTTRELRQLREENLQLRKLVKDLSRPRQRSALHNEATPRPRAQAS